MHVGFTPLGAARSSLEYYLRDAGFAPPPDATPAMRARYYARHRAEHRRASAWFGRGAEALGLSGPVNVRDFERVMQGRVPGTAIVLRRNRDGAQEHRTGWDLTLSVPKSVSLLWALLHDERIREAFVRAVETALRYAEDHLLETRGYDPDTKRRARVRAEGLVAALFLHLSNRNDEPQLHMHVVIVNMTRLGDEWRSVEPTALARHTRLLGAIAASALAAELRSFGYGLESRRVGRGIGFEAAGFSRRLLARFSSRRRDILRRLAETGAQYTARATQAAALATRGAKSGLREAALRRQWRDQVEADPRLARALANAGREGHLVEARAWRGAGRAFVARRAIADEKALMAWAQGARDAGTPLADEAAVEARLAATRLTRGQRDAVRLIVRSPHRAVAVQGFAGTGKTSMMREVVGLARDRAVFGLAPSAAAARVLGREAGIAARTVDWFLTRFGDIDAGRASRATHEAARALLADGILLVDESSMIAAAPMRALVRLAQRLGVARVVLCGDHRQLQSVRPGQAFRLLQEAGLPTAVMDELVRQRHPVLRKAVREALAGRPARALAYLGERLVEVEPQALAERAAHEFLALAPAERAGTLLVAPTHALRRDINAAVRDGLIAEGAVHGRALVLERLIDLNLTPSEKGNPANYQPGDEVVFVQDLLHYRVRSGEACAIVAVEGATVRLRHPEGTARRIDPGGPVRHRVKVCESAPITIQAGDRIRWTHNDRARGLLNGETARIERIAKAGVTLRTGDGRTLRLGSDDRHLRHIDHAYASTAHAAQGATCERVIAVLDADPMPVTNALTFYVQISRARGEATVLTDDREQLIATLEAQSGERASAHEALGWTPEPGGAAARVRRRGYERVRRDWARVRRRAAGRLPMAADAAGYAAVARQVAALGAQPALPGYLRGFVDEWLGEHARSTARQRAVEEVVEGAERRAPLPDDEAHAPGATVEPSWDEAAGALLDRAREIHRDAGGYGAHLEALDGGRERFERAAAGLWEAAFLSAERTVAREARAGGTIVYYAASHRAFVEHAQALQASPLPLPDAVRERAHEAVADHERRREERDTLERFLAETARGEARRAQGQPWGEAEGELLERAQHIGAQAAPYAPHLGADARLRRRFETTAAGLEAGAFRAAEERVAREPRERGTIVYYAASHRAFVEHAQALTTSSLPLPDAVRTQARGVVAEDERQRTERARVDALIENLSQVIDTRADGTAHHATFADDAAHAGQAPAPAPAPESSAPWEARATRIRDGVRTLLADEGPARAHLDAVAGRRERAEADLERLGFHCACSALSREWDALERRAEGARLDPCLLEAFDGLAERTRSRRAAAPETERLPARLERAIGGPQRLLDATRARLEALAEARAALLLAAAGDGAPPEGLLALEGYAAWRGQARAARATAGAMLNRRHRLEAHLDPAGAGVDALTAPADRIKGAQRRDDLARALWRQRAGWGLAPDACAAHVARDRSWYATYVETLERLDAVKANAAELPPVLARDLGEERTRMRIRIRRTAEALHALCAQRFALLEEAERCRETLQREAAPKWRRRVALPARRAFRARRDAWWTQVDNALAPARVLLEDEETGTHHADALAPMARDVHELQLLDRVAPAPAGPVLRWRTHVAKARAQGLHPVALEGYAAVDQDMARAAGDLEPGSVARETLEAERAEAALAVLRLHIAARLRALMPTGEPHAAPAPTREQAEAARRTVERALRAEPPAGAEQDPSPRRARMDRLLARYDALPRAEPLYACLHGLRTTVETGQRLAESLAGAAHPGDAVEAHRTWCAGAERLIRQAERLTKAEKEPELSVLLEQWPRLRARAARGRAALGDLHPLHRFWTDWSELRSAVAEGAALDREALPPDAPPICPSPYRHWYRTRAAESQPRMQRALDDEATEARLFEPHPDWQAGVRDDLARLARLRERHELCALAVELREWAHTRRLPLGVAISSFILRTERPGDPQQCTAQIRRALESPRAPWRRHLAELPALKRQIQSDVRTLEAYQRERAAARERDVSPTPTPTPSSSPDRDYGPER